MIIYENRLIEVGRWVSSSEYSTLEEYILQVEKYGADDSKTLVHLYTESEVLIKSQFFENRDIYKLNPNEVLERMLPSE